MAAIATQQHQLATDTSSVDAWLEQLPADACAALSAMRERVHALVSEPIAAAERFALLERVRARAEDLVPEQRKRYLGKPIPLAPEERKAWEDQVGLWQAFYFGYALCTDVGVDTDIAARIWQRALESLGRAIQEHTFAYRAIPASLWKELNRCYRSAEECGLESLQSDSDDPGRAPLSCKQLYLETVLHESANLYSVSAAQMQAFGHWLPNWLTAVDLTASVPAESSRSPLAIDLDGDSGAHLARELAPAGTLRYLDTSLLAPMLRDLAAAVRTGKLPPELNAGRDLPRPAIERLLTHLYVQWCSAGTGRIEERRNQVTRAQVAISWHAIHFQISGRAFRQPGTRYTREEEHDLATFGHITERTEHRLLTSRSSALEPWEIANQSGSGLLGLVRKPDLETRIGHGQLVAMRTSSIGAPTVGVVQRLKVETDGALSVGVRVVRAEARGVAVRARGDAAQKYERALMLEPDPERGTPAQLILAAGRFARGQMFELYTSRNESVMITEIVDQGCDYDRVTYAAA
jgi:cyclic-di-GMP-binding protein